MIMCGIAGIITPNSKMHNLSLQRMIKSLQHRGPDETGYYHFQNCSIAHARLNIIDLISGQQPMLNGDQNTAITFNGEIYGFKEIKKEKLNNYPFKTTSDTEVILALYSIYKKQFLNHLPGIFSFAIWVEKEQELICARDRFGEKPFYYAIGKNNEFIFASEIKAIIESALIEPILNTKAIAYYLKNLYINPFENIYSNIYTLPPAHILSLKKGEIKIHKYWNLPETNNEISFEEASHTFTGLLKQAVDRQLIADVPVSAFLSGGLDSSTIVALAAEINPQINVFTFGFGDSINETPLARKTAQKYGLKITELQALDYHIPELIQQMQTIFDEPFADSSNIPSYLIAKEATKLSKVVLTGDGGDELLGGYSWYPVLFDLGRKTSEMSMLNAFYYIFQIKFTNFFKHQTNRYKQEIYNIFDVRNKSVSEFHFHQRYWFSDAEIAELMNSDAKYIRYSTFTHTNTVNDAMLMDLTDYMPGDILVKIDRTSMANSLELRAPFLDVDLAEFCISLPSDFKISGNVTKKILRETFQNKWISELITVKKQGFGAPVDKWLATSDFQILMNKYLFPDTAKIYEFVNYKAAKKYFYLNNYKTWILFNLALWAENHNYKTDGK
jgi:asparagine synthase (glutamine-hydrolysing)